MDRGTGQATQSMDRVSGQATIHRVAESDMTEQTFTHSANKLI